MYILLMLIFFVATVFFLRLFSYHPASITLAVLCGYLTWFFGRKSFEESEYQRKAAILEDKDLDPNHLRKRKQQKTHPKSVKFRKIKLILIGLGFIWFTFGFLRFAFHVTLEVITENAIQLIAFIVVVLLLIPSDK